MTEKATEESPASSSSEVNSNQPDVTPMEVDDDIIEIENGSEAASSAQGTPASSPTSVVAKTPTSIRNREIDCFKTPESVTPSSAKKRKRLTPDEKSARERERQEKRQKLEEEKQRKEQEKIDKARQREEEKQKKEEEKRRQEEEKKLERNKKEEERKKIEEEKKQERLKKEEERKRIEEERKQERLKKEEERKKKDDEKKQKLEEKEKERLKIEEKKAKQAQVLLKYLQKSSAPKVQTVDFASVYPSTSGTATFSDARGNNEGSVKNDDVSAKDPSLFNPLPFQIKTDMVVAPLCRREKLSDLERGQLDFLVQYNVDCGNEFDFGDFSISNDGYLNSLKNGKGRCFEKLDIKSAKDLPEIQILDDNKAKTPDVMSGCVKWRMKLLQFHENRRPAYWGTWKKIAKRVTARKPVVKEEEVDYDFDSDDEWEDEPDDAEEIVDSDREEKEDQEEGGEPEDDEEGWMVPHGYLSDTEREGTGGDLESLKCKEKEFYKSLKEKTLIGLPFIATDDLSCFIMRLCPVFKSAITIKPVRKRAKKPAQSKEKKEVEAVEVKPEQTTPKVPPEQTTPKVPSEQTTPKVPPEQTTPRVQRKKATKNPYAKPPSGFLAMELPSEDEEDMDWGANDNLESSSSSATDSGEIEEEEYSSSDSDLFIPIKTVRRKD
ncbi:unnamed protein product [Orchesella dallaii]|uniref:Chromatin assembly factor 1 subunit A dimerization domain-containing protein n=1 Tax=Orchesella dallaii TaxID=48710 RepID=A0ABP1R114_9HEXA